MDERLKTKVGGITLRTPILPASGTFGWGYELKGLVNYEALGAIVTKGLSLNKREGNPPPRLHEIPCGLINSIGLQNPGVENFIEETLPQINELNVPVVVNVFGERPEDYVSVVERLLKWEFIVAFELNLSCPNVHAGGLEFGSSPETLREVVRAVKGVSSKPIWIKLSHSSHLLKLTEAAIEEGAEAVVLLNTLPAFAIDIETRKPILGGKRGGLSGPPLKYVALRDVWEIKTFFAKDISVIGCGGVYKPEDVVEFILAGADAVEIGTGAMVNPGIFEESASYLLEYLRRHRFTQVEELKGALKE